MVISIFSVLACEIPSFGCSVLMVASVSFLLLCCSLISTVPGIASISRVSSSSGSFITVAVQVTGFPISAGPWVSVVVLVVSLSVVVLVVSLSVVSCSGVVMLRVIVCSVVFWWSAA